MTHLNRFRLSPLMQTAGDSGAGGGGATPPASGGAPGGTGAPAPASTSGTTGQPASGTPASAAAAPPPAKKYEFDEDRGTWIPPHRMSEVSRRAQQLEAELAVERRRIQALTGVTPADPRAAERQELSAALAEIHPSLGKLMKLDDKGWERLEALLEQSDSILGTVDHHWAASTNSILQATAQKFGGKGIKFDLANPDDTEFVRTNLVAFIKSDRTGKRAERFDGGDHTVLDEFVTFFTGRFGAPSVQTTAPAREAEAQRQRLPQGGPRAGTATGGDAAAAAAATGVPKNPNATIDRRELHRKARENYLGRVGARS